MDNQVPGSDLKNFLLNGKAVQQIILYTPEGCYIVCLPNVIQLP